MARRGEYYPKVGLRAGLGIDKVGTYSSQGVSDDANGSHRICRALVLAWLHRGKSTSGKSYATRPNPQPFATLQPAKEDTFAITNLVAEIASSYYELQALYATLDVVKTKHRDQQNALTVVRLQRKRRGSQSLRSSGSKRKY